jgi:hypothetical protein
MERMVMPELKELVAGFAEAIMNTQRMSHASVVLRMTSILDYDLERCIKRKLRPLDKKTSERLFEGYGPISTFAARIDISYGLSITSEDIHHELNKIRRIRNKFAHTKHALSLDAEPIKSLFYTLRRPSGIAGNYAQQFLTCGAIIDDHLEAFLLSMGETEDLRLLQVKELETTDHGPSPEGVPIAPENEPR